MSTINFPTSPALNELYSFGTRTWQWNGAAWTLVAAGVLGPEIKAITLTTPIAGDDLTMFYTTRAYTVEQINDTINGSGSVSYNVGWATNRTGSAFTNLFATDRAISTPSGSSTTTFANTSIPANSWVRFVVSSVTSSTTVNHVNVTLKAV